MLSVSVDDLPLSKKEKASLRRADLVNAAQILYASPSENAIIRQLFEQSQFEQVQGKAAYAQAPRSLSVLELLDSTKVCKKEESGLVNILVSERIIGKRKCIADDSKSIPGQYTISTGDSEMDALLGGGIRRGCLTEIVGESSSGKSQLGMQTAVFTAVGFVTLSEGELDAAAATLSEQDNLYEALDGKGIRPKSETGSVAILNSGGAAVGRMMTRRMVELSNSLIAERWIQCRDRVDTKKAKRLKMSSAEEEKTGLFRENGSRSSLEEAQQMAKERLLENIKLCSPKDHESLEHAVSYFLPALVEGIKLQGKAPLTLIIIDDLPTLLIEEGDSTSQKDYTLRRSRFVCEIADRLKQLSVTIDPAMAIMVMNQVIDAMASNKNLFLPLLLPKLSSGHDVLTNYDGPLPLSSAFQDGFFNGLLASADVKAISEARQDLANGKEEEEAINRVSSTSKMAALGYSWVNCINVRIMLTRTSKTFRRKQNEKLTIRRAVSVINPFAKAGHGWDPHVEYAVLPEGLKSISSLSSLSRSSNLDEEEAMWSSFDANFESNEISVFIDQQEQNKRDDEEDEYLWAMGSDLDLP